MLKHSIPPNRTFFANVAAKDTAHVKLQHFHPISPQNENALASNFLITYYERCISICLADDGTKNSHKVGTIVSSYSSQPSTGYSHFTPCSLRDRFKPPHKGTDRGPTVGHSFLLCAPCMLNVTATIYLII